MTCLEQPSKTRSLVEPVVVTFDNRSLPTSRCFSKVFYPSNTNRVLYIKICNHLKRNRDNCLMAWMFLALLKIECKVHRWWSLLASNIKLHYSLSSILLHPVISTCSNQIWWCQTVASVWPTTLACLLQMAWCKRTWCNKTTQGTNSWPKHLNKWIHSNISSKSNNSNSKIISTIKWNEIKHL